MSMYKKVPCGGSINTIPPSPGRKETQNANPTPSEKKILVLKANKINHARSQCGKKVIKNAGTAVHLQSGTGKMKSKPAKRKINKWQTPVSHLLNGPERGN